MIRGGNGVVIGLEKLKKFEESEASEEATSRKCEGQLSSVKANSCSSYKGANRTTEMAQGDNSPCWDNLPSVILQEIFSYLSHDSRIKASQVCRNWRHALFHPRFWKKITFLLREDSISWVRFLIDCFGLSVHEATIRCDVATHFVNETSILLKKLSFNSQLRKLFLEFTSSFSDYPSWHMESDDDSQETTITPLMISVLKIVETSNHLEALSFGCIEELTACASVILEPLSKRHAKHLTHLSLASVKHDPNHYDFLKLDPTVFSSFIRLTVLTIDYDSVSKTLLESLDSGTMERLVIHVHGWKDDCPETTDSAWQTFVQKNPKCELRLNLIHSYLGVIFLDTGILCPSMPLTELKVLFCEKVNIRALHRLSSWYSKTLRSLIWIDSIDPMQQMPATYDPDDPNSPDPLVLVAWKCKNLTELVFIGHKYYRDHLLAIARLRGSSLKLLAFAENDVGWDKEFWYRTGNITHEIQEIMGYPWKPLSKADLPAVVVDPYGGDSREVIMPHVLRDQK